MERDLRNVLRNTVTRCRTLLESSVADVLEGTFAIYPDGASADRASLTHLADSDLVLRDELLAQLQHIQETMLGSGVPGKGAVEQLVREVAFTHLNRLCAFKMLEVRKHMREAVGRGLGSTGFKFYLADHDDDEKLWSGGQQELAYRNYLLWLSTTLSNEVGPLFSPEDPANRLFPAHATLMAVLDELNAPALAEAWTEDETIGWVYQYFTPKELRDKARKESAAPRNSYELAFRNQFYTPRYVVEFLVDNTLGRTWYEMRRGDTALKERCDYLVYRPNEVFLSDDAASTFADIRPGILSAMRGDFSALPEDATWPEMQALALAIDGYELAPRLGLGECGDFVNAKREAFAKTGQWDGSSIGLWICLFFEQRRFRHFGEDPALGKDDAIPRLYQSLRAALQRLAPESGSEAVYVAPRPKKDPRDFRILDPACGSGHFLLYAFDVMAAIYEEAWADPGSPASEATGGSVQADYPDLSLLRAAVPGLILQHNLRGIDIDLRSTQIAALALWLRAQRAFQELGIQQGERPELPRPRIVVAEPMPGEREMLKDFLRELAEPRLHDLITSVWEQMRLASEAGSLLRIDQHINEALEEARHQAFIPQKPLKMTLFEPG
ncbi:MAG: DNA methyltransferase, partial [Hyphomicrobiales bacterium]